MISYLTNKAVQFQMKKIVNNNQQTEFIKLNQLLKYLNLSILVIEIIKISIFCFVLNNNARG